MSRHKGPQTQQPGSIAKYASSNSCFGLCGSRADLSGHGRSFEILRGRINRDVDELRRLPPGPQHEDGPLAGIDQLEREGLRRIIVPWSDPGEEIFQLLDVGDV